MTRVLRCLGAGVTLLALLLPALPAAAIGTGGVDLTVDLPATAPDIYRLDVSRRPSQLVATLRNLDADRDRTVRLVTATAQDAPGTGWTLGSVGATPWADLDRRVTVPAGASVEVAVPLSPPRDAPPQALALVLETGDGSVVTRAVALVEFTGSAPAAATTWWSILAIVLLITAASAWARFGRRPAEPATPADAT